MNWKLYSFIVRSRQRIKIVLSLEKPKTPTQIAREIKASVSHVSRALAQFIEKGVVECITPEEKVGRIYRLTKEGKEILKHLKK